MEPQTGLIIQWTCPGLLAFGAFVCLVIKGTLRRRKDTGEPPLWDPMTGVPVDWS